jgi:hypothetical protein
LAPKGAIHLLNENIRYDMKAIDHIYDPSW